MRIGSELDSGRVPRPECPADEYALWIVISNTDPPQLSDVYDMFPGIRGPEDVFGYDPDFDDPEDEHAGREDWLNRMAGGLLPPDESHDFRRYDLTLMEFYGQGVYDPTDPRHPLRWFDRDDPRERCESEIAFVRLPKEEQERIRAEKRCCRRWGRGWWSSLPTRVIRSTDAEARARNEEQLSYLNFDTAAAEAGGNIGIDFGTMSLDDPIPFEGKQGGLGPIQAMAARSPSGQVTAREYVRARAMSHTIVGSPETVADEISKWRDPGINGINRLLLQDYANFGGAGLSLVAGCVWPADIHDLDRQVAGLAEHLVRHR